jgi:molybdate transport system substrate-binding protein
MSGILPVLALAAVLLLPGCSRGGAGEQVRVLGASSLTEALEEYGSAFAAGDTQSSFAGSDQLAAQIRQGARADVFASADARYPAELHRDGLAGEPVVFARNRLVVVTPRDSSIDSLAGLARPGTGIVAGDPSVPVGQYTRAVIGRLPADERVAILGNVRSEEPEVSSVLAKVVSGAADAGFVYVTDARTVAGQVRVIDIPQRLQPDIEYAATVLTASSHPQLARRYLDGLLRGGGVPALRKAGFLPP